MRDTLPFLVFYSLESKDDPYKSDSPTFYFFFKNAWHFTLFSVLVFNSLVWKDDPCKSDSPTFYPFWKMRDTLPFLLSFWNMRETWPFLVFNS